MEMKLDEMLNTIFDYNVPIGVFPKTEDYAGGSIDQIIRNAMHAYDVRDCSVAGNIGYVWETLINENSGESIVRAVSFARGYNDIGEVCYQPFMHNILTVVNNKEVDYGYLHDGRFGDTVWWFGKSNNAGDYYYVDVVVPYGYARVQYPLSTPNVGVVTTLLISFFERWNDFDIKLMSNKKDRERTMRYSHYRCYCLREVIANSPSESKGLKPFFVVDENHGCYIRTTMNTISTHDESNKEGGYVNKVGPFEKIQYNLVIPEDAFGAFSTKEVGFYLKQ